MEFSLRRYDGSILIFHIDFGKTYLLLRIIRNPLKTKKKIPSDLWPIRLLFLCDLRTIVCGRPHTCRTWSVPDLLKNHTIISYNSNNDNKPLFDVIRVYGVVGTMVITDFYFQCWRCHNVYAHLCMRIYTRINRPDWCGTLTVRRRTWDVWYNADIFPCTRTRRLF